MAMRICVALTVLLFGSVGISKNLLLRGTIAENFRVYEAEFKTAKTAHFNVESNQNRGLQLELKNTDGHKTVLSQNLSSDDPAIIAKIELPQLKPGTYTVIFRQL